MKLRSVSFDTSFLLKDAPDVDRVLGLLKEDGVPCFVTKTVISELDLLKTWDRIDAGSYKRATRRWKGVAGKIIDFHNSVIGPSLNSACKASMEEFHGVGPKDIENDCNILVTGLTKGIDLFLSEDIHFTSRVTDDVLKSMKNKACDGYRLMCREDLYATDHKTFLKAYRDGILDIGVMEENRLNIRKPGKRLDH